MNSTLPTSASSMHTYKDLLLEARKLRGRAGLKAYDRAVLLCRVFEDGQFREECGNLDDFRAAELLDDYVDDLCLGFFDLRAMLDFYPRRKQWSRGALGKMHRQMLTAKTGDEKCSRPSRSISSQTRKQLEMALESARREKARLEALRHDEVEQLRQRIAELEAENQRLTERIRQLEGN